MSKENINCEVFCVDEEKVGMVREKMLDKSVTLRLSETFKVLGDPTRIKIIQALSLTELCVCDISTLLNMSQSAISHQLRVLRNLRLVKFRKEGKIVYYSLDDKHIVNLFKEGLEHVLHD